MAETPLLDGILGDLVQEIEAERPVQPGDAIKTMVAFLGPICRNNGRGNQRNGYCDPPFGWCELNVETRGEAVSIAVAIIQQEGWLFHDGHWYCPGCVATGEAWDKPEPAPEGAKTGYRHRRFTNKSEWERIKREQNYTCLHCGRAEPEIMLTRDHIDPGGSNTADNIQGLCIDCNRRKGRKKEAR